MTTIRVHEGRIFNPRETELPDGRRVLSATFHPGAQGGQPVTMVTDRPLLDDVFREGTDRRFLGRQTARNLVVLGSLAPIANPTLRRLATVVMALQQGQAIQVGDTTYRIGDAGGTMPELVRDEPGQANPQGLGWSPDDLIAATGTWPADVIAGLAKPDYADPTPPVAALMVMAESGWVNLSYPIPGYDSGAITLKHRDAEPDRIAVESSAGCWSSAGLDSLLFHGVNPETFRPERSGSAA